MQYKEIQEQFNRVISYSQDIENPQTDELFEQWLEAKRDFIEAMNGNLIFEWPEKVSFELGQKEKSLRIDDFIDLVLGKYDNIELADFLNCQRDNFFSNLVSSRYKTFDGTIIPAGMKIIKAFKYFEKDPKILNDLQSAASMIIQEDKIEGTLCFSVHPLDFLSASENNHNWRSCHALNGDYRAGNLSYMVDKSTVICYLKSSRMEKLPNFPEDVLWNSKKWRVWLYFSERWDMMFAGRQYPFYTESGLNFVKERVLPILRMGDWSPWMIGKVRQVSENGYHFYFSSPYIPIGNKLVSLKDLISNEEGSLQFNDLLSSSCYDPMYAYKVEDRYSHFGSEKYPITSPRTKIKVGGKCKCLRCAAVPIELSETMLCTPCELKYGNSDSEVFGICPNCSNRFIVDDGYWIESTGETICESCADNYTDVCECCGERFYQDDIIYDSERALVFCKYCFEELEDITPEEDY